MAKHSLKLLFLRKYRTSKKYYRQLKSSVSNNSSHIPVSENSSVGENLHPSSRRTKRSPRYGNNSSVDSVDCCLLIYECISQNKLRAFVFMLVVGILSSSGLYIHNQQLLQYRIYREDVFSPRHGIRLKRCTIPVLRPFSSEVKKFIFYNSRPNCIHEQRGPFEDGPPFSAKNGSLLVRNALESDTLGCCYRPFQRSGDTDFWRSHSCTSITQEVTIISPDHDYIEILCISPSAGTDFRDGFALTHRKTQVEDRIAEIESYYPSKSHPRMSVVILGLDATSRMNFIRAMPKSNKYLLNTLSAISLNGYTKVAENTLPNLIPLLSGRTLEEFKKECVDESKDSGHSIHLDECPFIWKTYADNGYRTSFSEDDVDIGIFNMNWGDAFLQPPTDYYLRPFSLLMQKKSSFRSGYCYGPSLSFEKLLESIRSIAEVFDKESYFQFTWSTKLSHDDFNKLRWGDEPLYNLLHYLNSNSYLNNTALLVVRDHGSRLDQIRRTAQGKLEDRMPVAYFVLPSWFKAKYPRAYRNLKRNSDRVTSPFDIHKTLHYFMNLDNLAPLEAKVPPHIPNEIFALPNNQTVDLGQFRGTSLFQEVPENRTCFAAGVPLHWCVCHTKIPLDKDLESGADAARFVIIHLNTLLHDHGDCATLELRSVDEVSKWDPSEIVRDGCEALVGNSTYHINNETATTAAGEYTDCDGSVEVMVLQIAFTAGPSGATFETTLIQLEDGRWRITEDVVRKNSYEGQSACVEQKLKPYCYCVEDDSLFGGLGFL